MLTKSINIIFKMEENLEPDQRPTDINESIEKPYTIDYDIITGKVELNEAQSVTILVQLWDNALKAGILSAQDTILIHKAIKLVSEKLLPVPPESEK